MLKGKTVVLGVSGGIAAYKACEVASRLVKLSADVRVVMTKNALEFVSALTFETLTRNRVVCDTFDRDFTWETEHISLAKRADIFVIAPATANVIGKIASGIADDFLTTAVMAFEKKVLIAPAMNSAMYNSPAVRDNIAKLESRGFVLIEPGEGRLACGDTGHGRLAEPSVVVDSIVVQLLTRRDFAGRKIVVTAGGTSEPLDPVRVLTNRSSGKMGIALARAACERGADATLIYGNVTERLPDSIACVSAATTADMLAATLGACKDADLLVMAAAPCDYTADAAPTKLKSRELSLTLRKTEDIAKAVKAAHPNIKLIIFAAETENAEANARKKLADKNADIVAVNDVSDGKVFGSDNNDIVLLTRSGRRVSTGRLPKTEIAEILLEEAAKLFSC
ncbi:MAG: bifunctional phosphopantothenoylcysteine decarboxylase/phosphopantothenate--cysteine ligase CoaBC [Firmicutes bacterium]|nr:bifunctional phosphopantothenoylcysteine decarboxylase/phosphopantothenate--cysteine ligase CoaBC [Bacillota bacterium]